MNKETLVIPCSIVISIVLHILVAPLLFTDQYLLGAVTPSKSTHLEVDEQPLEPVTLGIEESTTSTLTWIGYEEYTLHMAQFSQYEQAKMVAEEVPDEHSDLLISLRTIGAPIADYASLIVDTLQGIEVSIASSPPPHAQPQEEPVYRERRRCC